MASSEVQIRALIDRQAKAIRAKDIDGGVVGYAPDVLLFDVVGPLHASGSDALRERLAQWFASFEGPIGYELRDLQITAGSDVAFSHSLNHVDATTTGGARLDMWWRATVGWRRIEGAWLVTHAHASVPFEVETGRAALDLKP